MARFAELILGLDPEHACSAPTEILKGDNEMTIPELRGASRGAARAGTAGRTGRCMALHRKFSIPFACLVFALIGLALGLSSGRGGKLAAFVPGIAVVFAYYVLDYLGRQMAKGQLLAAVAGASGRPNIVLGLAGVALLLLARAVAGQADAAVASASAGGSGGAGSGAPTTSRTAGGSSAPRPGRRRHPRART